jgi:hypothetical protein
MIDEQYTKWLKGLTPDKLFREEYNLNFVLNTNSITTKSKINAERKLNLLKKLINDTSRKINNSENY